MRTVTNWGEFSIFSEPDGDMTRTKRIAITTGVVLVAGIGLIAARETLLYFFHGLFLPWF